ncbi:MAG: hypothetical protein D6691_02540 [Candidatus Hydrogenedentota bacterium]|jgi:hypothetical protein|nr:MAG: hypothetical protein D6691_02540 [Candidatus Hydrogenedentota bacterium]
MKRYVLISAAVCLIAVGAVADEATRVEGTLLPSEAESRILRESFCYSASVERSYVVGVAPRVTSRFMNPRTPPTGFEGLGMPHYRPFPGIRGYYFCSTGGFNSGAPEGSHAHAYHTGDLGITAQLSHGYPNGKRVIEPVLVPVPATCRPGGFLIQGAPTQIRLASEEPAPRAQRHAPLEK